MRHVRITTALSLKTTTRYGFRALHTAALKGHVSVVNSLIAKGEKVDMKTYISPGYTALHLAVREGRANMVECLLGNGADAREQVSH